MIDPLTTAGLETRVGKEGAPQQLHLIVLYMYCTYHIILQHV